MAAGGWVPDRVMDAKPKNLPALHFVDVTSDERFPCGSIVIKKCFNSGVGREFTDARKESFRGFSVSLFKAGPVVSCPRDQTLYSRIVVTHEHLGFASSVGNGLQGGNLGTLCSEWVDEEEGRIAFRLLQNRW